MKEIKDKELSEYGINIKCNIMDNNKRYVFENGY